MAVKNVGGTEPRPPFPWLPVWVAIGAAALTLLTFSLHLWQALDGDPYRSYVGGIWIALGQDLSRGVFYRELVSGVGYGGTRYFPLFFSLIGGLMRPGAAPLAAGAIASAVSLVVYATGLFRVVRAVGVPKGPSLLFVACGVAPYFVQQTLFQIRADVLAAGFNLWGLALGMAAWGAPAVSRRRLLVAGVCFTLAIATKVTSLVVPAALVLALVIAGQRQGARRLGTDVLVGAIVVVVGTDVLSDGRAMESWRACMFAGAGGSGTFAALLTGEFVTVVGYSHFLTGLFLVVLVAIGAAIARGERGAAPDALGSMWLPGLLFLGVSASTAFTLSSPGTVPSNQVVEWIAVSVVILAWTARRARALTRPVSAAVLVLTVWAAAQDAVRARALAQAPELRMTAAARQSVVDLVTRAQRPVLSESPLWPVLAGKPAYVLDPFALRVVAGSRPDVLQDLEARLDARMFEAVLLEWDPATPGGRGWYEHVNFGWPVMQRILENYQFERQLARDVRVYVPRR